MGSTIYGAVIEINDVEKEFWKALKSYILSLDSRITCAEDPDDEFDYSTKGNDHIATMNFKINNTQIFKIHRTSALRDSNNQELPAKISLATNANVGIPELNTDLKVAPGIYDQPQSTVITRKIMISHIINDNFIHLAFNTMGLNGRSYGNINYSKSGNDVFIGNKNDDGETYSRNIAFNLTGYTLYNLANPAYAGTFLSRFSYAAPQGNIDYIKSSIYQNNGEKVFENKAIYDCTTVIAGDTVSLKDGAYIAVGTNQLVKVS